LELATLVHAGLSVDRALNIMAEIESPGPQRELILGLQRDVRGGMAFSEALAKRERLFSRFYVNIVRAGELSGAMDQSLSRLARFLEDARELRKEVGNALLYPIILVFVALLSLAVILGVVVPQIAAVFEDSGQSLPWFTEVVIGTGKFIENYGWVVALIAAAGFVIARHQAKNPEVRLRWDGFVLGLPLLRTLIAQMEAARFMRTLGTLIENGVNLLEALAISREVVSNHAIAQRLEALSSRVREGQGLARPLMEAKVFPSLASHLVRVGEETGSVDAMLLHLAAIYEREVQSTVKRVVTLLGPILILGLAVMIAAIMFAVMVPILSINELALTG
ncbi:MAG TPA: type II secretion system F family protein, partial [Gammaproteobacteria bacterium]|nr:type II secretion system F family protein [Gammaproteobacteria bacterium]